MSCKAALYPFFRPQRSAEVPDNYKNVVSVIENGKDDLGDYSLNNLTAICGKIMEQVLRETILIHTMTM